MKGNITISRPSYGDGRKLIKIVIQDEASRIRVVDLTISYEDFAQALTGLGCAACNLEAVPTELMASRIGRELINKWVYCEKAKSYRKDDQKAAVAEHFSANYASGGWELSDDGTGSQQPGSQHRYLIRKWEEEA